jgi:hypothetical protein
MAHAPCVRTYILDPYAAVSLSTDPYAPCETVRVGSDIICDILATPGLTVVTHDSSLGLYTTPQINASFFYVFLSSLVCTQEDFSIGHPS